MEKKGFAAVARRDERRGGFPHRTTHCWRLEAGAGGWRLGGGPGG